MKSANYTQGGIIRRYNDAISDLAEVQASMNIKDDVLKEKHQSDAGEALSQTLEWALHYHIKSQKPDYFNNKETVDTPTMIRENFKNRADADSLWGSTISEESPTVDFNFLCDNKDALTNDKKHRAQPLDYNIQKRYAVEIAKFIHEYINDDVQLITLEQRLKPEVDKNLVFYNLCNTFSHSDCLYILLLDKSPLPTAYYSNLTRIEWDLVIDMYSGSVDNGFHKNAIVANEVGSKIINIIDRPSEETFPLYNNELPLIMANGIAGSSVTYQTARDWSKNYNQKLSGLLQKFFEVHQEQKVIVISLISDEEFVRSLFGCIDAQARGLQFIITNDKDDKMTSLPRSLAPCILCSHMDANEVNQCIGTYVPNREHNSEPATYTLPGKDKPFVIKKAEMPAYEENFEVLYDGIDEGYDESEECYLKGLSGLTWEGAHRQFAAIRSNHHSLYVSKVEKELARGTRKAMLIHEPGYGGTTVARQIAYDLHHKYPTLILKQYKNTSIKTQLERIYDSTSKQVLVIAEIPQAISYDDFFRLQSQLSVTRPIMLLGVKRGNPTPDKGMFELQVTDWGNDVCRLADKFRPYLKRYTTSVQIEKEKEFNRIVKGKSEPDERTPFYIGLLTFEEDFVAIDSYLRKFVRAVRNNEYQRKTLIYLAMCDIYDVKYLLPEGFFATVFDEPTENGDFRLSTRFNESDGIVKSLLASFRDGRSKGWKIKHPFLSKKLLPMLLNGEDVQKDDSLLNIGSYCKQFIDDIARSNYSVTLCNEVLQPLFIGTKAERSGEYFTSLVNAMDEADQEDVLNTLHVTFPDNPHFCSHLARYYSKIKRDFNRAIEYADKALALSIEEDSMLYHIKAMCYARQINYITQAFFKERKKDYEAEKLTLQDVIENLLPLARENFSLARQYQYDDEKEITYLPNIYMLINVFDYTIEAHQLEKKKVLSQATMPYCEWIDEAESLLDALKQTYLIDESEQYTECEAKLWNSINEFTEVISLLNSQLDKGKNTPTIRRLLARTYFWRNNDYKGQTKTNARILALMEQNIAIEPTVEKNYILWFNAARYSSMSIDAVLSKINQWKALASSRDLVFYAFVFNSIKALGGDSTAAGLAGRLLDQCRNKIIYDYIYIKEWYTDSNLYITKPADLRTDLEERIRVYGRINTYKHTGDARILLDCGLEVFFKPSVAGITEAHLNHRVSSLIGFSYDGLRALDESVTLEEE